jgi:hypothetical protein
MREFIGATYQICPMLLNTSSVFGKRLSESGQSKWLDLALAAVSLENLTLDYRDSYVALGSLYLTALEVGVDPSPAFERAAEWSANERADGGQSVRGFFAGFEVSAYFAESVARRSEGVKSRLKIEAESTE